VIAYVMLDGSNPFFHDVAQGIESAAEDADLSLFICNSNSRTDREEVHLDRLLQQRVQGILITPIDPHSPTLEELALRGTPVVIGANHGITLGATGNFYRVRNSRLRGAYGIWRFDSLGAFEQGNAADYRVSKDFGGADATIVGAQYGIYAGDQWQLGEKDCLLS